MWRPEHGRCAAGTPERCPSRRCLEKSAKGLPPEVTSQAAGPLRGVSAARARGRLLPARSCGAREPRTALLLQRSDERVALALGEAADALLGAHVAALQEACSLYAPVSRQGHEHLYHLGRGEALRGVADEGLNGDAAALQIGLEQRPLHAHPIGLRQCFAALIQ